MAKMRWLGPVLAYHSSYGGESLRGNASETLTRLQRALSVCAMSTTPDKATLTIYDAQSEPLYNVTRSNGPPKHDPLAARTEHGTPNPLVTLAEARFGAGEPQCFGEGASGDLWLTNWQLTSEMPDFESRWLAMSTFVSEYGSTDPIYWSWSHRSQGKPSAPQIELHLHFEPIWKLPGTDVALPGQSIRFLSESSVHVFLRRNSSAIFDIAIPLSKVDEVFANWEQTFCQQLGIELVASRWQFQWVPESGEAHRSKHDQARYRRSDWTEEGKVTIAPPGPWDADIDALLAPRVKSDDEWNLRYKLATYPRGAVVFGLITRMAALKGTPLERGCHALKALVREKPETRSEIAPAVRWVFANPPASKQMSEIAYGLTPVSGDPWYLDLVYEQLTAKKIPPVVWDFIKSVAVLGNHDENTAEQARLLVTILRKLRPGGASRRRAVFGTALGHCDDGSAWATWLLELATVPADFDSDNQTWAWFAIRDWKSFPLINAKEIDPYRALLPSSDVFLNPETKPQFLEFVLTDAQRAELDGFEQKWLGIEGEVGKP